MEKETSNRNPTHAVSQSIQDSGNQCHLLRVLEPIGVQFHKQQAKISHLDLIFHILPWMKLIW
jgi:hypothetical protein